MRSDCNLLSKYPYTASTNVNSPHINLPALHLPSRNHGTGRTTAVIAAAALPSPRRRTLESPITAPGQQRHEQQHHQAAKEGAGVAHSGGREWVHSGRRGHTEIFIRPPRPASNAGAAGAGGTATTTTGTATAAAAAAAAQSRGSGGVEFSTTPGAASVAGVAKATPDGDEDGESSGRPGRGGGGEGAAGERGGGKSRSEAEEAWSCCGKTVESAGRGCEPREPLATVGTLF